MLRNKLLMETLVFANSIQVLSKERDGVYRELQGQNPPDPKTLEKFMETHYRVVELADRIEWINMMLDEDADN